jgi:hypothetical protein
MSEDLKVARRSGGGNKGLVEERLNCRKRDGGGEFGRSMTKSLGIAA